jgi:hypothetical protein
MINQRFYKWTVLDSMGVDNQRHKIYLCKCGCGKKGVVRGSDLRRGNSRQCQSCSNRINGRKGLDASHGKDLYMVSCGEFVKIGSSDDVIDRVNRLAQIIPYPVKLEYFGPDEGYLEPLYHTIFEEFKHRNEWFKL